MPRAGQQQQPENDSWSNWKDALETSRDVKLHGVDGRMLETYGKWSTDTFDSLMLLGEGAFGVVHLVQRKGTEEHYALKQMPKKRFHRKNERAFAERDAMSKAHSQWCVKLFATFQDAVHVYMVMEFVQGGDLMGLLTRRERLSEADTAFYMAELVEALDTVHRCGFVHRDVKPDNIVIDVSGHIKLLDFGLCKGQMSQAAEDEEPAAEDGNRGIGRGARARLHSIAGTPQYMAPEGFAGETGPESDLWSLGIITFECLAGVVPFHAGNREGPESVKKVREQILNHAEVFNEKLRKTRHRGLTSDVAERLLRGVVCDRAQRLTSEDIRREAFFEGVNWHDLYSMTPPFVPEVSSRVDTRWFDPTGRAATLPSAQCRLEWDQRMEFAHYATDVDARASRA